MLATTQDSPETRRRKMYLRGATPIFSCRADPRFSFCLYVPAGFDADPAGHTLVVVMHGTGRSMETYRDRLSAFAQYKNCVVLAPLFPGGVFFCLGKAVLRRRRETAPFPSAISRAHMRPDAMIRM